MRVIIRSLWGDLGSPLLGKGDSPWLVWVLCGQQAQKSLEAGSFIPFLGGVERKKRIMFDNEEFSVHRLKYSFVCSLWSWTKLYIDVGPLSLIDFFDWLGSR